MRAYWKFIEHVKDIHGNVRFETVEVPIETLGFRVFPRRARLVMARREAIPRYARFIGRSVARQMLAKLPPGSVVFSEPKVLWVPPAPHEAAYGDGEYELRFTVQVARRPVRGGVREQG